jgi:hypothetical protein
MRLFVRKPLNYRQSFDVSWNKWMVAACSVARCEIAWSGFTGTWAEAMTVVAYRSNSNPWPRTRFGLICFYRTRNAGLLKARVSTSILT